VAPLTNALPWDPASSPCGRRDSSRARSSRTCPARSAARVLAPSRSPRESDMQTVSRALAHESTAITSRIYLHAVESTGKTRRCAWTRSSGSRSATRSAGVGNVVLKTSGQQRATRILAHQKNRAYTVSMVAPTGVEPSNRGPGRSRQVPQSTVLWGFSFVRSPGKGWRISRNPDESVRRLLDGCDASLECFSRNLKF
jgi:hypothetical protein